MTENRIAVISIIAAERTQSVKINAVLSEFGDYVLGRMGIPYKDKSVYIISVAVDAPAEVINTITGKIGQLEGVTAKTLMSKFEKNF